MLLREPDSEGLEHYVDALIRGRSAAAIAEAFITSDEFRSKRPTNLFVPPGHYYSPIVDVDEARSHLARVDRAPESLPGIDISRDAMLNEWQALLPYLTTTAFPDQKTPPTRFAFENPSYSWGDGSVLSAMLRRYEPRRLIEIGSGWSSACSIDTIERYLDGKCEVTFIEPYPDLLRSLLGTTAVKTRILGVPVQDVSLETFDALKSGDFLFIDSTHVLRTGSDVCRELFDILPRLTSGVFVHIHDMFWPFEYPEDWIVDDNRSWNELYAVRAFLTDNPNWRIVFFNNYFAKVAASEIAASYPQFLKNAGGALWLQRR
jgi:hypothetical protein